MFKCYCLCISFVQCTVSVSVHTESDFIGTPIVITLPNPDGGTVRQVELEIPIIDDLINEHQETLVGFIEITDATDEGTINLGRTAAQLIIDDNDGINQWAKDNNLHTFL